MSSEVKLLLLAYWTLLFSFILLEHLGGEKLTGGIYFCVSFFFFFFLLLFVLAFYCSILSFVCAIRLYSSGIHG